MDQLRTLLELEPEAGRRAGEWLRICNGKGVPVLVYETRRPLERQAYLYASGRTRPGSIVTNAQPGRSFHNYGLAWDAVPWEFFVKDPNALLTGRKLDWGPFSSPDHRSRWESSRNYRLLDRRWRTMALAAEELDIEWAGLWTSFVEFCHFQFTGGRSLDELEAADDASRRT